MKKQKELPFDKAEYSRRCTLIETMQTDALSKRKLRLVRHFVKCCFKSNMSSYDGTLTFRSKSKRGFILSAELEVSPRALQNRLHWARSIGVIETNVDCDEDGRKRTTLQINWARVELLSTFGRKQSATTATQCASNVEQRASTAKQSASSVEQSASDALCSYTNNQETNLQWSEAVSIELKKRGVVLIDDCVESMEQRNELDVTAVLTEFDTGKPLQRWDNPPGALVWRLTRGSWPPDSDKYKRSLAEQSRAEKLAVLHAEAKQSEETKAADSRLAAELETRFGPALDAMNEQRRETLIESVAEFLAPKVRQNWRREGLYRTTLLEKIADSGEPRQ